MKTSKELIKALITVSSDAGALELQAAAHLNHANEMEKKLEQAEFLLRDARDHIEHLHAQMDTLSETKNSAYDCLAEKNNQLRKQFAVDSRMGSLIYDLIVWDNELMDRFFPGLREELDTGQKIPAIKVLKSLTSLGLKDSKDFVDQLLEGRSYYCEHCEKFFNPIDGHGCNCSEDELMLQDVGEYESMEDLLARTNGPLSA